MTGNRDCTVYIGNLDEKVSDRVLYDILIQAGRVVDLHIGRDKETNRHKGYAFAEYETAEIADYAVKLFSGLVTLYNRTLKFAYNSQHAALQQMSGQDKSSQGPSSPITPMIPSTKPMPPPIQHNRSETSQLPYRFSAQALNYAQQEPAPPGTMQQNGYRSNVNGSTHHYDQRAFGPSLNGTSRSDSGRRQYDSRNPVSYSPY